MCSTVVILVGLPSTYNPIMKQPPIFAPPHPKYLRGLFEKEKQTAFCRMRMVVMIRALTDQQ